MHVERIWSLTFVDASVAARGKNSSPFLYGEYMTQKQQIDYHLADDRADEYHRIELRSTYDL